MSPDPQDAPAGLAEKMAGQAVARGIAPNLAFPIFCMGLGHAAVPGAAVPEAAIHEDRQPCFAEAEVWTPREQLVPAPSRDMEALEDGEQFELG